jgi:transketolase
MNSLQKRIIEISDKKGLSHRGSNLTAVNIISAIYFKKMEHEPFILSSGHCGLALYVVLEQLYGHDAEMLHDKHGTHPNRDLENHIYCSTGSLGCGITIAAGMAAADRTKNVYCLISDGESFEGSLYEVSNIVKKYNLTNLKLYCNFNGWGAYHAIPESHKDTLKTLFPNIYIIQTDVKEFGYIGQESHYVNK